MKTLAMTTCFLLAFGAASAFACGIEGTATRGNHPTTDGPIATSWTSKSVFPDRNGRYTLDLGSSSCGESVEIYVRGCSHGRHRIPQSGNLRFDVHFEGQNNTAVGCRR